MRDSKLPDDFPAGYKTTDLLETPEQHADFGLEKQPGAAPIPAALAYAHAKEFGILPTSRRPTASPSGASTTPSSQD